MAARYATTILFRSGRPVVETSVFPDLANIFSNFLGQPRLPEGGTIAEPDVLVDSLLTLVVLSLERPVEAPESDEQFEKFVLSIVACSRTPRLRRYNRIGRLAWTVFHSNPSSLSRFRLVRKVLEDQGDLGFAKETVVGWTKDEILSAMKPPTDDKSSTKKEEKNVFIDPKYFASLFPLIYDATNLPLKEESSPPESSLSPLTLLFLEFTQNLAPYHLAALNLYYLLIQSYNLRTRLEVADLDPHFSNHYKSQLVEQLSVFIDDKPSRGGDGIIEKELGEEAANTGMHLVEIASHTIGLLEDTQVDMLLEAQNPPPTDSAIKGEVQ